MVMVDCRRFVWRTLASMQRWLQDTAGDSDRLEGVDREYRAGRDADASGSPIGAKAQHRSALGGTQIVFQALVKGDIDVYPEYTGTLDNGDSGGGANPLARCSFASRSAAAGWQ